MDFNTVMMLKDLFVSYAVQDQNNYYYLYIYAPIYSSVLTCIVLLQNNC